jgi:hypothetical protein
MARNEILIGARCIGYVEGNKAYANCLRGGHVATYFPNMDRTDYMGIIRGSYRGDCLQGAVFAAYYASEAIEKKAKDDADERFKKFNEKIDTEMKEKARKRLEAEKLRTEQKKAKRRAENLQSKNNEPSIFSTIKAIIWLTVIIMAFIYPTVAALLFWYVVIKIVIALKN